MRRKTTELDQLIDDLEAVYGTARGAIHNSEAWYEESHIEGISYQDLIDNAYKAIREYAQRGD